jgi:rSAM/selenodomain-associated transferase 2
MQISIIIPTYNEASVIKETIGILRKCAENHAIEIIVADGESSDNTQKIVREIDAKLLSCPERGRAAQMNYAANQANGTILYFLHADTHPPEQFDEIIYDAVNDGYDAGCFQLAFDNNHGGLQFYSLFTRQNWNIFRFGDQSLFVKRSVFKDLQGFRNEYFLMEDQEFVQRINRSYSFKLLNETVTTSSRKYGRNGVFRLQLIYTLIFCFYYLGISQNTLRTVYKRLVK